MSSLTNKKEIIAKDHKKKPAWLKITLPSGANYLTIRKQVKIRGLNTVCAESNCPNLGECWNSGTAAFMLLGDTCTRACRFCAVKTSKSPPLPDPLEPANLAKNITGLHINYVVLTTVDRDDLDDMGAKHIRDTVLALRKAQPELIIELLLPDFQGNSHLLKIAAAAGAQIIAHNLECVQRLTSKIRDPKAGYDLSLRVLRQIKESFPGLYTKSSLMLGWNETDEEVLSSIRDIKATGCSFLTLGQYLQPAKNKLPVENYVTPEKFQWFKQQALSYGFQYVAAGPLVRSSYKAAEYFMASLVKKTRLKNQV